MLFDPLRVQVCPACLTALREAPHISDGHCTLCNSEVPEHPADRAGNESGFNGTAPAIAGSPDGGMTDAKFDVSSELRATKDRLAEITKYVGELDAGLDLILSGILIAAAQLTARHERRRLMSCWSR